MGFDFGFGKPEHVLQYFGKLGLIPKTVRMRVEGIKGHTVGCYPVSTLDTLLKIQKLRREGRSMAQVRTEITGEPNPPTFDQEQLQLPSTELVRRAQAAGFDFGPGKPVHVLQYYSKLGLLPKTVRLRLNGIKGHTVGCYPAEAVETLLKIQKLRREGVAVKDIAQTLGNEGIKPAARREEAETLEILRVAAQAPVRYQAETEAGRLAGYFQPPPPERQETRYKIQETKKTQDAKETKEKRSWKSFAYTLPAVLATILLLLTTGLNIYITSYQKKVASDRNLQAVLAESNSQNFLDIRADTDVSGRLTVWGKDVLTAATLASSSPYLSNLNQNLSTTATPTFANLNLTAGKIVLEDKTQTLKNKSLSGSDNTFSNIPNSALANSKVTVTAGTNLTGGGDVVLGDSTTIGLKDNIALTTATFSGLLGVGGDASLSAGLYFSLASPVIATTDMQSLTLGNSNTGNIQFFNASNYINSAGNLTLANSLTVNTTTNYTGLVLPNGAGINYVLTTDALGHSSWTNPNGPGTSFSGWTLTGNTIYPNETAYDLLLGSSNVVDDVAKFTNLGSTLFKPSNIANLASGGDIGTAATTVDIYTTFNLNQTTSGQTITLPNPTNTTAGRLVYLANTGTTPFNFLNSTVLTGTTTQAIWNGTAWTLAGSMAGLPAGTVDNSTMYWDNATSRWLENSKLLSNPLGTMPVASVAGTTSFAGLVVDNTIGDLFTASSSGKSRFTITQNGNVGVGMVTPTALWQVFGNSTVQVASVSASTGNAALLVDNTIGDLFTASSSGMSRFVITQSGNVGIGTTNPGNLLEVDANSSNYGITVNANNSALSQAGLRLIAGNGSTSRAARLDFLNVPASTSVPRWTFINDYDQNGTNDFRFVNSDGSTSVLTLLQGGNVGIGTTGPAATLQVNAPYTTAAPLTWGATAGQIFRNENSELAVGLLNSSPYPLYLQGRTNTSTARDIVMNPSGGSVGIGTTGPNSKLTVNNTGSYTNLSSAFSVWGGSTTYTIGSYSYPAEIQTTSNNLGRLQFAGYRKYNPYYDWGGTGFRIQYAVDNSFTDGSLAYLYLGTANNYAGQISFGVGGADRVTIDNSGNVSLNTGNINMISGNSNTTIMADGSNYLYHTFAAGNGTTGGYYFCTTNNISLCQTTGNNNRVAFIDSIGDFFIRKTLTQNWGSDLAEGVKVNDPVINEGDLLVLPVTPASPAGQFVATRTTRAYQGNIAGVVSTKPGIYMNSPILPGDKEPSMPDIRPLALSGRVPVKVSTINGPVTAGDLVTSSELAGIGMKASVPGVVVGRALQSLDVSACQPVASAADIVWPSGDDGSDTFKRPCFELPDGTYIGKVMVLVNLGWQDPTNAQQTEIASQSVDIATISATLASWNDLLGTPSATLADSVAHLDGLSQDISSLMADNLQIKSDIQLLKDQMASVSANLAQVQSQTASNSAQLALGLGGNLTITSDLEVSTVSASFANFSDTLKVVGKTELAETNIGGSLTVGLLRFDDLKAEISSLTGTVTVNSNLQVAGDATVSGTLQSDKVKTGGITIKDKVTGEPYCVTVENGVLLNTKGECQ